jgi:hypothetical protein
MVQAPDSKGLNEHNHSGDGGLGDWW